MRYAVVSDIRGNLPALQAVTADARANAVNGFLFAGDHCMSNPYPNECISLIRSLENKHAVRGNEEGYLEHFAAAKRYSRTSGQMQISHYAYHAIQPDNLRYLLSMPEQLRLCCEGTVLHIAHSSAAFIGDSEHRAWSTARVALRYSDRLVTPAAFRADILQYFENDAPFQRRFAQLEDGVYIFGHSHQQWHYSSQDGKKLLLNPGSCGLPVDCVDAGLPYTILDLSAGGGITVEERRVAFDTGGYIQTLRQSEQYEKANVWSRIVIKEWQDRREYMAFFLAFAEEYAAKLGDSRRPFARETWENAFAAWEAEQK